MATVKQKKALKKFVENGGKSVSLAMREVGYSKESAKNPQKLTSSKGWSELVKEFLPEDKLLKKVNVLINAKRKVRQIIKGDIVFEAEQEDAFAISKGLEFAFKIRNSYAKGSQQLTDPTDNMTDEQIDAEIARLEALASRYTESTTQKAAHGK